MSEFWNTVLSFAQDITAQVGAQLLKDFGQAQAAEKADGSLVTQSDQWADEQIRTAIAASFPDHGVLSEEVEHIFPDRDWCWIIDPVDGTTNFARGLPLWGISIGLLYKGTPVFGFVHLPPLGQSFYGYWQGESGLEMPSGAFLNGKPIHSSQEALTKNHFFNLCTRSTSVLKHPFPVKIRMLGVATYNLLSVAAGATMGGVEATPKIWDIAAVWAIVQAAGAVWYPLESEPIFPLKVGKDYAARSYPTLVISRKDLIPVFEPLVRTISKRT
ncbi:MAG: inositol monophosphatase family protein [Leptolyngbya sp. Prado105]|jgi:myo-inositol-1(or 4)-monophosphatase|nr:inositol monophosphatase family protein [Leptolyngbya sp. Prado105]